MVAIHGNGVDHRILLAVDGGLAEVGGLERIYLDLPGFGGTPPLRDTGGLPELAAWLLEEIPDLVGGRAFALLASSLGGLLARHVHTQLPDRVVGIALFAPVVDPDPDRRQRPPFTVVERDEALLDSLPHADLADFTAMTARQTRESPALFERVLTHA